MAEDELLAEVAKVCWRFRCRTVVTDQHKAREIRARMASYGIDVHDVAFSGDSRREVFAALRLAIDDGAIGLPNDPDLLKELRAMRVRYTGRGQVVDLPHVGRSHCDQAVALALGVFAHGGADPIDPAAGAAVALPGRGWSDGVNGAGAGDIAVGSPAYWRLTPEEQHRIALTSGMGAGAPAFVPHPPPDPYGDW